MLVAFDSKKEVVKEIIKHTRGGRLALAGAIGMNENTFNNKLYERNGCRFFDEDDLEAMEIHAGTFCLAQYRANQRGGVFVRLPEVDADTQELSEIQMKEAAALGELNVFIHESIRDDGAIDRNERKEMDLKAIKTIVTLLERLITIKNTYKAG